MNAFTRIFMLSFITSLALVPVSVFSEELKVLGAGDRRTPYGHSPGAFCSNGAQDLMAKLNKANEEKFDEIESYRNQLKNLAVYDNLLAEATLIKNRYEQSVSHLLAPTSALDSAGNVKSVVNHGLMLNALPMAMAESSNPKKPVTMETLCNDKAHQKEISCKEKNAQQQKMLNEMITGFQDMASQLSSSQQAGLKKDITEMIATIPKDIDPKVLIEVLGKDSPVMVDLLSNADSNTMLCLSDQDDKQSLLACGKNATTPEARKELKQTISKEALSVSAKLKVHAPVIATAVADNQSQFTKELDKSDAPKENIRDILSDAHALLLNAGKSINSAAADRKTGLRIIQSKPSNGKISVADQTEQTMDLKETTLNDVENFFYKRPSALELRAQGLDISNPAHTDKILKKQNEVIELAMKDGNSFKDVCDFSRSVSNDDQKIEQCKALLKKVSPFIDSLKTTHATKIRDLSAKIKALNDDEFKNVENLKEYVAEKYLCSCEKKKFKTADESLKMSTCNGDTNYLNLSRLENLSESTSVIAQTLFYNEIKMPMDYSNGTCGFSPAQLATFSASCTNAETSKNFKDVCNSINGEIRVKEEVKIAKVKENKKWEDLNRDNYVSYDARSPTGYSTVKKKSSLQIFGEGVLPILPMALPMWLGNLQERQNIDMLTNQAIFQKQYLYNMDIYNKSPWMYDFNYFMYNPLSPTTNTGSTTPTLGTAYNFGL